MNIFKKNTEKHIEEKVDAVRAEEEKSKRKENRNYEQRR